MERAACKGADPNLFNGVTAAEPDAERLQRVTATVARFCKSCPVQAECLTFGQENDFCGVWGGLLLQYGSPVKTRGEQLALDIEERPCGTYGGFQRHRDQHTRPCPPCQAAHLRQRALYPDQPCGTTAGYRRHYRRGERPCADCRVAEREDRAGSGIDRRRSHKKQPA